MKAEEQSWWDKLKAKVESLFKGNADQATEMGKAIWDGLDATSTIAFTLSAAFAYEVSECKDGSQTIKGKCYLAVHGFSEQSAKEKDVFGRGKVTGHVELTLPFKWATVDLGTCACDTKSTNLMLLTPEGDDYLLLTTSGRPEIALKKTRSTGQFSSLLPVVAAASGVASSSVAPQRESAGTVKVGPPAKKASRSRRGTRAAG